ncbi:GNAT family N-acetyltransferase [Photobacterium kagoshimensis]|uniref:GNAT family N-acetyltransferase n=1 Tax=Photobacterium kagoshimensis TaxID=2910242 RepID=UPI003D0D0A43
MRITIRPYVCADAQALWQLFFDTVKEVNSRDYSQAQVKAWAPANFDFNVWQQRMAGIQPFVAEIDGVIVGYTDLQASGLIDHFFCHHQYQGKGVGRALMQHVLNSAKAKAIPRLYSEVSITARPFYEHYGFFVVREQTITVRGQKMNNFILEKWL